MRISLFGHILTLKYYGLNKKIRLIHTGQLHMFVFQNANARTLTLIDYLCAFPQLIYSTIGHAVVLESIRCKLSFDIRQSWYNYFSSAFVKPNVYASDFKLVLLRAYLSSHIS